VLRQFWVADYNHNHDPASSDYQRDSNLNIVSAAQWELDAVEARPRITYSLPKVCLTDSTPFASGQNGIISLF
jgi:hypothetical protein